MSTLAKYPRATQVAIYSLGFFLGALHIFLGSVALTPLISQDYHREMKINFNAYAKSLSFLHQFVDKASLALFLRYALAASQTVFGLMLVENGHFGVFGRLGNFGLLVVDFLLLALQLSVGTAYERLAPTLVFNVLLVTRLLIIEQSSKRTRVGVKTRNAGKPKTSTPKKNKNE